MKENKYRKIVAEEIRSFRKKKKLTLQQLEHLFNSTPPLDITVKAVTISKYENCDCSISIAKYLKFKDLFKLLN